MKTRIELIDKKRAEYYLSLNPKNRPVTESNVNSIAQSMVNGFWKENTGEAIKISKNGYLIDGQHRLIAIAKTDSAFNFLIVYDVELDIFDVLDTGKKRGASDVFALNNIPNYNRTCAIIKGYLSLKEKRYYKVNTTDSFLFTNTGLLKQYSKNPDLYDKVSNHVATLYISFNKIVSAKDLGAFYLMFNESNPDKCNEFFNQLCGKTSYKSSPVLTLSNVLIKDKLALKKIPSKTKYAYIVKAWNSFVINKEMKLLKFDDKIEQFPEII